MDGRMSDLYLWIMVSQEVSPEYSFCAWRCRFAMHLQWVYGSFWQANASKMSSYLAERYSLFKTLSGKDVSPYLNDGCLEFRSAGAVQVFQWTSRAEGGKIQEAGSNFEVWGSWHKCDRLYATNDFLVISAGERNAFSSSSVEIILCEQALLQTDCASSIAPITIQLLHLL